MEYEGKTFGDYLAILMRRRMLLLTCFVVVWLPGVYGTYSIPATYRSTATILIEQQNISEEFVQSTVTGYADEQIQEVRQRVMSTPNLTEVIQKHGLYPELTRTQPFQVAVEELRNNTLLEMQSAEVVNQNTGRTMLATIAFSLSFDYVEPQLTQAIARELADLYLSENVQSRTAQVQNTIDFLEGDIRRTRAEVESTSEALAAFKERNAGNLPELLNFHLQSIERTEQQIDGIDRDIRDARNRKLTLETELARATPLATVFDEFGEPILGTAERLAALQNEKLRLQSIYSPQHPDVVQIQKEIETLSQGAAIAASQVADIRARVEGTRLELQAARQRYSPEHPDVLRYARTLETLEAELAAAIQRQRQSTPLTTSAEDPIVAQLRQQVQAEDAYISSLTSRRSELQVKLIDLDQKVASMPRIEREYEALLRDAELANRNYGAALAEIQGARRAETLESEGAGQKFTLIEPPQFPAEPYKPNRTALLLLAIVLGLGAGVVIATATDTIDPSIKNAREVARLIDAPPLAVIPYLETSRDKRLRYGRNAAAAAMMVTSVVGAFFIASAAGQ